MISGDSVNAILELTYECNFACPFCYVPWIDHPEIRGKELRTEEWKEIIDGLAKADVASLTFTGGEPLMRDDIFPKLMAGDINYGCEYMRKGN